MPRPALVIMARWPAAGRCKSRLATELGSFRAASVQYRLTKHTLAVAQMLHQNGLLDMRLAVSGLAPKASKRWAIFENIDKVEQQGKGNLGLRIRKQVLHAQKKNHPQAQRGRTTIVIGTDLPELCERDLIQALDALKDHEMVLGPSSDGGYWLIGLARGLVTPVATWPFCGIPWGSEQVLEKTLKQAKIKGIKYSLLREQNDLDRLIDLTRWQA